MNLTRLAEATCEIEAGCHDGSDEDGKQDGSLSERPPQQPPDYENRELDTSPDPSYRYSGHPLQTGHPAVSGTRPEVGCEVDPAADTNQEDAYEDLCDCHGLRLGGRESWHHDLYCDCNQYCVEDCTDSWPLPQRNPQQ